MLKIEAFDFDFEIVYKYKYFETKAYGNPYNLFTAIKNMFGKPYNTIEIKILIIETSIIYWDKCLFFALSQDGFAWEIGMNIAL